jgi:uncharacterized repeat protein (TIGR01451 family)
MFRPTGAAQNFSRDSVAAEVEPTGVTHRRLRAVTVAALLMSALALAVDAKSASANDTVAVSASAGSVAMGSNLTYTISIGPSGGTPAIMTDQVNGMTGLTVSTSSGSCSQSAGLVTCQTSLAQATTVTISGTITAPAGTTLHNVAVVDPQPGNPVTFASSEADVQVTGGTVPPGPGSGTPDLVTSIVAPSTAPAGAPLTYTLVVGNQGTGNANNINVVDTLPANLGSPSVTSTTPTSLFQCGISGQTVTCTGGRIDAGADADITITGTAPASGTLTDLAVVDPFDTIPESNYNNNTSEAQTTVAPNPASNSLGVSLSAAPTPDVAQGEKLTYTIKVTNNQPSGGASISDLGVVQPTQGLDPASIAISFTLPAGQSQNVAQACSVTDAMVQCFSDDNDSAEVNLAPGQTMTVTVSGTVTAPPAQKIFEAANVVGGLSNPNSNSVSASATTSTQVKPAIDLSITKASLAPTVNAAAPFQYQYVVGNSGLSTATGIEIRDPLPAAVQEPHTGYMPTVSPGSGFMCTVEPGKVLRCTGGTIGPQSTATITVNLIAPEATGAYTSIVQVDPNNAIPESDENNNSATATTTVVPGADLSVSDTVDFNPVATSGTLDYTILVPNLGTQDTTGVEVDDTLPAGTTFRSAAGDHNFTCSYADGIVKCVGGIIKGTYSNFPAGIDTAKITVSVFAPAAPGQITNEIRVDPNNLIPEINKENNIFYLTTSVAVESGPGNGNYIDLSIPKLESTPEPVAPNGTLTYAMTVQNTGTEQAFNVEVTDTLPSGARFRSASGTGGFTCSASGQLVTCVGGEIDNATGANPTRTITIQAFAPPEEGKYVDQAIVDPKNAIPEADEANNEALVTTQVLNSSSNGAYVDLALETAEQTETPTEAGKLMPGGKITYKLAVSDKGSEPVTGVALTDTLPSNATFVSASGTGGFTCTQAQSPQGTIQCVNGTVTTSSPDFITITVSAPNASGVTVGPDQAVVNPTHEIPESTYTNNSTTTSPVSVFSNINLEITQEGPGSASQNQTTEYKITVKNKDPLGGPGATAMGVQVHDPLPDGLIVENIKSEPNTFACQVSENPVNVIDCNGNELKSGEEVTIVVSAFVTAADSTTFTNEACVDPNRTIVESTYADNCSTVETAANTPDLSISQSVATSPISPGQNEVYTIGVANTGSAAIAKEKTTVIDKLPPGLKFEQASGTNGFTCTNSAQEVTCKNASGSFNEGETATIKVTAEVTSSAKGPFANEVKAEGEGVTPDNDDSNTVSTNLNATGIDLVAESLKATPDPVNQGAILTYTGVVSNNGVQDSGEFEIDQTLPPKSQVTLVTDTASHGFGCTYDSPSNTVKCKGDLAPGTSTTLTIQLSILSSATGPLTSTMTANPTKAVVESDYTNNSQTAVTTVASPPCTSSPGCVDLVESALNASPSPTVEQGGTLTYNYAVGNAGNLAAHGVVILLNIDKAHEGFEVTSATATGGYTCVDEQNKPGAWVVACNDPSCSYSINTITNPPPLGTFSCTSPKHSDLPGKAGVIVSVTGNVPSEDTKGGIIESEAFVEQSTTDFSPFDDGPSFANTEVVDPPSVEGAAVTMHVAAASPKLKPKKHKAVCGAGHAKSRGKQHAARRGKSKAAKKGKARVSCAAPRRHGVGKRHR